MKRRVNFVSVQLLLALILSVSAVDGGCATDASGCNDAPCRHDPAVEFVEECSDNGHGGSGACASAKVASGMSNVPLSYRDPNLEVLQFDFGDGPEDLFIYVTPNVSSIHGHSNASIDAPVQPKFNGFAGCFINLSKEKVRLYWEPKRNSRNPSVIDVLDPFSAGGTATFPHHRFYVTSNSIPFTKSPHQVKLQSFTMKHAPHSLYYYDPYHVPDNPEATEANLKKAQMTETELDLYRRMRKSVQVAELYFGKTGRSYLVHYPRDPPNHFMWPAEYIGQQHWIISRETHFERVPTSRNLLPRLRSPDDHVVYESDAEPRRLEEYRTSHGGSENASPLLNLTLTVLSVAPRVLEIENFLSHVEVDHILSIARGENLGRSETGMGQEKGNDGTRDTRTSYNSWVERERTPIIDAIYRRAADLLRIDEALLRRRRPDENFEGIDTKRSIAEHLQLVHYDPGQEYTAHHDFGFSKMSANNEKQKKQSQRFATILFYLNDEDLVGGHTIFPRWHNGESFEPLRCQPVKGKAVLFYSQLPDGNMDDLSQHEATKVWEGEKWLINLWVWSPTYE